jgi:5-methyltetrahydropteroyltriglutamate--homocysteine methyltransferase
MLASGPRLRLSSGLKNMTVTVATLGFPRIGPRRELKHALESYWSGKSVATELLDAAAGLRAATWARQKALGADVAPERTTSRSTIMCSTPA